MLLNGEWKLHGKDQNGNALDITVTVPGCVHTDLMKAGLLEDVEYRDNNQKALWIENNDFTYERTFDVSEIEDNAYLIFEGLDTYCDIYLNDRKLGSADNMHIRHEFCVDGIVKTGENHIEVRFFSPVRMVADKPELKGAFTTERLHTRRMQCTYYWDWVDRFLTMGIYRDVELKFKKPNEIKNFYLYTKSINHLSAQLDLTVEVQDFAAKGDELEIEIISPDGRTVFAKKRTILIDKIHEWIDIREPKLWYPNGYGEQPLYTLKLSTPTSERNFRFGIRQLVVVQLEDEANSEYAELSREVQSRKYLDEWDKNETSSGFIVLVNDVKIMCKGANWVPCEPFPSEETPDKIRRILELSKDAGVNMLRVWGGGIFEQDAFYEECDRLGILVTQDFLMACGNYPENEPEFIEQLKKETEYAAYKLRNFTCLAWWHGDNENAVCGNENITDYPGYLSATYGMTPILEKLDPVHMFLPSSPYGGKPFASAVRGTTHNTNFCPTFFTQVPGLEIENHQDFLCQYLSRFCSEHPTMGMPFVSALRRFLTEDDIFGNDNAMTTYHTKNNPEFGETTLHDYIDMMAEKFFGTYKNGEDRIYKLQELQCEWIRITMELYRRYKWYASGMIFWMLSDCWAAATGWSIIDYYANPKPSYYAFKRASKPVIASVSKEDGNYKVYICNDSLKKAKGKGKLYLYDYMADKKLTKTAFCFEVDENMTECILTVPCDKIDKKSSDTTLLLCDIEGNFGVDNAFYIPCCFGLKKWGESNIRIVEETDDYVTVTADEFTPFAIFDTPYVLEDNCFMLKKGETRRIKKLDKTI